MSKKRVCSGCDSVTEEAANCPLCSYVDTDYDVYVNDAQVAKRQIEDAAIAQVARWLRDGRAYAYHVNLPRRPATVDAALMQLAEAVERGDWRRS